MGSPNIVLIGHVCIDHNKSEHASYDGWGAILYMSQYFQKHCDVSPIVIASYGPDMLTYLPETNLIPAEPNQPDTLVFENDTSTGKRKQRCYNLESAAPPAITDDIIDAVRHADVIIVATFLPNYSAAYLDELLGYADPDSLKVLCPQGYFRNITPDGSVEHQEFPEADSIIPKFDLVIYSEEDCPEALSVAKGWKQSFKTEIVVTQGAEGASIVGKDENVQIPTHPIPHEEIVDSVGCGDTFAATVTFSYYETRDLRTAILDGHAAAGKKLLAVITIK
jgi:sugar/nucleoside kinase (ribokinase family)